MHGFAKFYKALVDKRIVLFGTGAASIKISHNIPFAISYYVDNNPEKWETDFNNLKIKHPIYLLTETKDNLAIVVASMYYFVFMETTTHLKKRPDILPDMKRMKS
jgi:hypothetical protein